MNGPVLFTERLVLRPPAAEDFEAWAAFGADPVAMAHLGGVQARSIAWRGLCAMAGAWTIRGFSVFSVIERSSGRWVGRVGPHQPEGWPGREIAWSVASEFAGKGYAFEAARAAIDYATDVLGWESVIHCIPSGNLRSIALARRLGSRLLGPTTLPAPYEGIAIDNWGQSAAEWRARRATLI